MQTSKQSGNPFGTKCNPATKKVDSEICVLQKPFKRIVAFKVDQGNEKAGVLF